MTIAHSVKNRTDEVLSALLGDVRPIGFYGLEHQGKERGRILLDCHGLFSSLYVPIVRTLYMPVKTVSSLSRRSQRQWGVSARDTRLPLASKYLLLLYFLAVSLSSSPHLSSPWLAPASPSILTDVSTPNPSAGLLTSSLSQRSYCLIAAPWDPQTSTRLMVYLSSDGYASGPTDTLQDGITAFPHQLFRARLLADSVFNVESRVMSAGQLIQSPAPSFGVTKVILADDDPDILYHLSLWWKNATISMYVGDPDWPFQQFIQFAKSTVAQITRDDAMTYSISWGSSATILQQDLQPRKYRGMGGALRFNNPSSVAYVTGTCPGPSGNMALECWMRAASITGTFSIVGWQVHVGSGAGTRALKTVNGVPRFSIITDGGTLVEAIGTDVIPITSNLQYGTHLEGVIETAVPSTSGFVRLLVNGIQVAEAKFTDGVATTLGTLWGASKEALSQYFPGDIDEVRIWNIWRDEASTQATMNGEISPTTAGLFAYYKCNDQAPGNVTVFDSCTGAHHLTLTNAVWIGSLTGGPSIAGKPLPTVEGPYTKFEPVPVDDINGVWQINHGSMVSITDLEHRGLSPYVYDGDVADITTATPASGHWSSCLAQGIFKLNAIITGRLLATGKGDNQVINGIGYVDDIASIARKKALLAGMPDDQIDLTSVGYISGAYPYKVWYGTRLDPISVDRVLVEIMSWIMGWRITTRDGKLSFGALATPSSIKWYFDETSVAIDSCTAVAFSPPPKQTILGYARYGQTQSASELSTSDLELVSDLGQEYRTFPTPISTAAVAADSSALPRTLNTAIASLTDASTEALRQQAFWAKAPVTVRAQTTDGEFQYAIGDGVNITMPIEGLEGGFNGMIVAIGNTVPMIEWFEAIGVVVPIGILETTQGTDVVTTDTGTLIEVFKG